MILSKKFEVKIRELIYIINQTKKTAKVTGSSDGIIDITIPQSIQYGTSEYIIKKIKSLSFSDKRSLKSINFSKQSQLEEIEDNAFQNSSLEKITIPSSVKRLGDKCFSNANNLKHIFISPKNENFSIIDNQFLVGNSWRMDGEYDVLYFVRSDIKKILIPSFIRYLSFDVLKSVKIIIFSENSKIEEIPKNAFSGSQIEEVLISNKVKSIGENSFLHCEKLKLVNFYDGSTLHEIGNYAFYGSAIEEIKLPLSVSIIGCYAFAYCNKLKKVEFANNSILNSIGNFAFLKSVITSIFIPSKTIRIHKGAFYYCEFLESIEFAEDSELNFIDEYAFANTSIEKIAIPLKVKIINEKTFQKCKKLQIVSFDENSYLESIKKCAFSETPINTLFIPSKLAELQSGWCKKIDKLTNIIISKKNNNFEWDNHILIGKSNAFENSFDTLYYARSDIEKIRIPSFIKKISSYAFSNCQQLRKVDFSLCKELYIIDKKSFSNTMIKKLQIPSTVTRIEDGSFSKCQRLESVEFKESNLNYIGKKSFASTKLEFFYIPSTVVEIGEKAFYDCVQYPIFSPDSQITFLYKAFSFSEARKLIIPPNIKMISSFYLANCYCINSIEFMADDLTFDDDCFCKTMPKIISCPNTKKFTLMYTSAGYYDFFNKGFCIFFAANTEIISPFFQISLLTSDMSDDYFNISDD